MTASMHLPRTRVRLVRRGMTLIEVIIAIVILSGAMLGLANFGRLFQHNVSTTSGQTLASDLATQRIETIKAWRAYSTLIATYDATTETFVGNPVYNGFTRKTKVVRCSGCPTVTNDYITVTVTITGNNIPAPLAKTTIIAAF
jgi:prepilin-type N-terminal cleavage/methylation domain-containing protein